MAVLNESLDTIFIGEDISIVYTLTARSDPTSWALKATYIPISGTSAVLTTAAGTVAISGVTGSGTSWSATVTVTITSAKTALFSACLGGWQVHRTDTGSAELLGEGTVPMQLPRATIP